MRPVVAAIAGVCVLGLFVGAGQGGVIASEDWSDTSGNDRTWPSTEAWGADPGDVTQWRVDWTDQWNVYWLGASSGHRNVPDLRNATAGTEPIGQIQGHQNVVAYLDGFTITDSLQYLDVRPHNTTVTATNEAGPAARFDPDTGNWYAAFIDRAGTLGITRYVGNSRTYLQTVAGVATDPDNPFYTIAFEVEQISATETALRAKAWIAGTAEPTSWMIDIVDTHAALQNVEGHVGIRARSSGNRLWHVDNFQVIPEPATLALVGMGALGLLTRKRRSA